MQTPQGFQSFFDIGESDIICDWHMQLHEVLSPLAPQHRTALQWFHERAGSADHLLEAKVGQLLLATRAKGIYKPSWTEYALSIRQSLGGPYPDIAPIFRPDGTWYYLYFQEGNDIEHPEAAYTNAALLACAKDQVPVGVAIQTSGKPNVSYQILGLALVVGWDGGYFFLEGFSREGNARVSIGRREVFPPSAIDYTDARKTVIAAVIQRQGQARFRRELLDAYSSTCAFTGSGVQPVLEAAHIVPYLGPQTNRTSNGLLLRADVHSLYDLGLVAVRPEDFRIVISRQLGESDYAELSGMRMRLPQEQELWPDRDGLANHLKWAGL
jgi:putative restriction endonuclease